MAKTNLAEIGSVNADLASDEKSLGLQLIQTARLQRTRAAQLLLEIGLFPGQEQVLQRLARHNFQIDEFPSDLDGQTRGIAMSHLAAELRIRAPTISKTIDRLSAQGLVERQSANGDKRQVYVRLTPEGLARAPSIEAILIRLENELVDGLDTKDRKRFRKFLRRATKNLDKAASGMGRIEEGEEGED